MDSSNDINKNYIEEIKKSNSSVVQSVERLTRILDFNSLLQSNNEIISQLKYLQAYSSTLPLQEKLDKVVNSSIQLSSGLKTDLNDLKSIIHKEFIELSKIIDNNKPIIEDKSKGLLISYPTTGTATITSGSTVFDFRNGIVRYQDNTEYYMSGASEYEADIYIKSFTIFVDRPVDISIFGRTSNTISIPSGSFRLKDVEITRVEVHANDDTNIWISGSTLSDGSPNISFSFDNSDSIGLPNTLVVGSKTDISTTSAQITTTSTPINKVVTIKVRSLGTGTYIAIGNSSSQPYRLTAVGMSHDIDTIDNLNKVYIITDAGSTSSIEWFGG